MTKLPADVIQFPGVPRRRPSDCQGERPPSRLLMSQFENSARALDIDFSIRAKALQEQEHKDAWEDFRAAAERLKKAAPINRDPREQMILFIRDMPS